MSNDFRNYLNLFEHQPVDKGKYVKINIETLARGTPHRGKYFFNKGFMTFSDIINNPKPYVEKYRKESKTDTSRLITIINGLKVNPKFTDKEHYFRVGYEARGFSNSYLTLVWFKEKQEDLIIFAQTKEDLMLIRDFLKFYRVINT